MEENVHIFVICINFDPYNFLPWRIDSDTP